jgi:hypothetical protein
LKDDVMKNKAIKLSESQLRSLITTEVKRSTGKRIIKENAGAQLLSDLCITFLSDFIVDNKDDLMVMVRDEGIIQEMTPENANTLIEATVDSVLSSQDLRSSIHQLISNVVEDINQDVDLTTKSPGIVSQPVSFNDKDVPWTFKPVVR